MGYTKEDLYKLDAIEIYKLVLEGKEVKSFPHGFWKDADAKKNSIKCTRYLIEKILNYDEDMIKEKNSKNLFVKYKLSGMLAKCFNNSPYEAINHAYPDKFKEWEFKSVPNGYWSNKENGIKATKWLIEEKLQLSEETIKLQLSRNLFINNNLGGMLQHCFNDSPYEAINAVYPNKYKEWEFNSVPQKYWNNKENAINAIKWLIEDKLKLTDSQLKQKLSQKLFTDNGLRGMLNNYFNDSPYKAINEAYPDKFKEWEFNMVPNKYWNKENSKKAVIWLIEERLNLSDEELKQQLSCKLFMYNGLNGMLKHYFNGSPYNAINHAYPNKFKKDDFKGYY